MPSPDQERINAISEALAAVVRQQRDIGARLARIEQALGLAAVPIPAQPAHESAAPAPPPPDAAVPAVSPAPAAPDHTARSPFETRLGLTLLNRAGVITLVFGVLFFFKYAVDNKWIGETGRVILGVLAGFLALGVGDRLWRKGQSTFAQGISGCGIAVLYVSFYASFGFYKIVPQGVAFLLMALNTAVAGVLAMRYGAQAIAALGLVGGYLTPVLLSTGENRPWVLLSYVLLLDLGALWAARIRRWRPLEGLAGAATFIIYFVWFVADFTRPDRLVATLFAFVFYALFVTRELRPVAAAAQLLAPLAVVAAYSPDAIPFLPLQLLLIAGLCVADRRGREEAPVLAFASFWIAYSTRHSFALTLASPGLVVFGLLTVPFLALLLWIPWRVLARSSAVRRLDLVVLALNAAVYFGASYGLLDNRYHAWLGLFAALVAALHFLAATRLRAASGGDLRATLFYSGIALCFLTLAIPIQFAGYRVTMAWALEGMALAWIAARIPDARLAKVSLAVFLLAVGRLLWVDSRLYASPHAYTALLNPRFLTFATTAVALWLAARWNGAGFAALAPYVTGQVTLLWGLILEVTGWAARNSAPGELTSVESTCVSILLAAYAVVLVALGVHTRSVVNRILGLLLIGLVVLKLYLYDVWQIGRMYRVAAFAGLGAFLLLTSFLYSHFRGSIESWWRDEETHGSGS